MISLRFKTIRAWAFKIHRMLGLVVGLAIALIGLTGSLLVFSPELSTAEVKRNLPAIEAAAERRSLFELHQAATTYAQKHDPLFVEITEVSASEYHLFQPEEPLYFGYVDTKEQFHLLFMNPYTAEVIGDETDANYFGGWRDGLLALHESLLMGQAGLYLTGAIGLLATILSLTGILLWPGWRKLTSGFKIKWQGHIKRRNFDLHKVVGIGVGLFLTLSTFTGFCWNYSTWTMPVIYALTFSQPGPTDKGIALPVYSQPLPEVEPIGLLGQHLSQIVRTAETTFPDSRFSNAYIGRAPTGVIDWVQCYTGHNCQVMEFDKYSGELIRTWGLEMGQSLGDRIINTFPAVHYGLFGGQPTRILYVLVGLSPTVLMATGFVMWRHRRRPSSTRLRLLPRKRTFLK